MDRRQLFTTKGFLLCVIRELFTTKGFQGYVIRELFTAPGDRRTLETLEVVL